MILTCPECSTKYVVKDGAIPDGGRQVRCAACKHSWHQDPDPAEQSAEMAEAAPEAVSSEATPEPGFQQPPEQGYHEEPAPESSDDNFVGDQEPVASPEPGPVAEQAWQEVDTGPERSEEPQAVEPVAFEPYFHDEPVESSRRSWPLVLTALLLAALAAVAFWFLAPADLKARVGIADRGGTPLQVMGLSQNRQRLASGNDLFTVSGRIVNPTDESQRVPPLQAELLAENKQTVIYRWTIAPPAETLQPNDSKVFHSAEMGVPDGGKYLRLRLVAAGG